MNQLNYKEERESLYNEIFELIGIDRKKEDHPSLHYIVIIYKELNALHRRIEALEKFLFEIGDILKKHKHE